MQSSAAEIQFNLYATGRQPGEREPSDAPSSGNGRLPRVTQVMALAIHFQDMLRRQEVRDYADLARLGCVSRERMSQLMELLWLAPEIQQEILEFRPTLVTRFPISESAVRRIASILSWDDQRQRWKALRASHNLI
jgi:hypothetical protein